MVNVSNVFLKASKHFIAFDPLSNKAIRLRQVVSAYQLTQRSGPVSPFQGPRWMWWGEELHHQTWSLLPFCLIQLTPQGSLSCVLGCISQFHPGQFDDVLGVLWVLVPCWTPRGCPYWESK